MSLSNDLISQFVKITKDDNAKQTETTVYGTIKISDGKTYVQIDGSTLYTPISATTTAKDGDRVTVMIKDHSAVVTGNMSAPSARQESLDDVEKDLSNKIDEFGIIVADKVSTDQLNAVKADITELTAKNATITGKLEAAEADIDSLEADNVTINNKLTAHQGKFDSIDTTFVNVTGQINAANAKIETLEATDADFRTLESDYGTFKTLTTDNFTAVNADIDDIQANKLSATDIEGKYANIDFSNIGKAAIESFFSKSGMIDELVVGDGTVAGKLVGVTIVGDLIEGGTVKADKLVILGEDGLYYKLNTNGETVETEQTEYNSLDGSHILAQSITASKITVDDLVAFGATIGGFHITDDSIYSGVKESVDNTTRGIYLGNDGQISFGDANNFLKFYIDESGNYKLAISAESLTFSSSKKSIEEAISDVQADVDTLRDEITTLLRIESSRGTVFKNDTVATVLSVVIYHGSERITDSTTMKSIFGNSAYLQWKWQRLDDETFGVISASDSRFGDNGFTFTLSPEDVDTKVTFMCELIV